MFVVVGVYEVEGLGIPSFLNYFRDLEIHPAFFASHDFFLIRYGKVSTRSGPKLPSLSKLGNDSSACAVGFTN